MIGRRSGNPYEWVADAGRPAALVPHEGMPTFQHVAGELVAVTNMRAIALAQPPQPLLSRGVGYLLEPLDYRRICRANPDGPVSFGGEKCWRPHLWWETAIGVMRLGSQMELTLRHVLGRTLARPEDGALILAAERRARKLLREFLCPQQRLDVARSGWFFVRGEVNALYRVEVGNGLSIVDAETRAPLVSICLHPESWLPHDDVALAIKLLIDSGADGERQLLERANHYPCTGWSIALGLVPAVEREREAWRIEQTLYPPARERELVPA